MCFDCSIMRVYGGSEGLTFINLLELLCGHVNHRLSSLDLSRLVWTHTSQLEEIVILNTIASPNMLHILLDHESCCFQAFDPSVAMQMM